MLTFCDGKPPQVINALQSKECVFSTIIPEINEPWYLKFNNSAIYDDNTGDLFTQMFLELGMKSFDKFIEKLIKLPRKSLKQSREVLEKRERIIVQIEGLRKSLNNGISKLNEIEETYEQFYLNQDKVNKNKDFTIFVHKTKPKKFELKGEYATNCKKCKRTCHYPCHVPSLISLFTIRACHCIENGRCTVCGCSHSDHENESYKWDNEIEVIKETAQEVFERYNEGKEGMANAENLLKKLEEEYYEIQIDCYDKQQEIIDCNNRLSEIALNGRINNSNEYLDQLIETENEGKKSGYKERINGYKQLKETNKMIEDIMKNSITKKSREEIKAELERKMNEIKEREKLKIDKYGVKNCVQNCVIC
ncbi:hypothetical protein, conserved [Entamoeba dispar SAW760]|uniref:Uncharacterized protein n=1 Tax=Entamoeba dispar (strain ATCC PRA-260 / SAW760) TaxID=370354 RepID=B0EKA3_ENTDS|nr:uncharacterized protein EDI_207410 [Entamoeba dispar SAW760]EDR25044.1 hypothetical protein, conserved [Entamoeba dispar SAW760]|eukprot:EDR25044.1 hypothetical protein, conserved [Entamoeba dispar SAW760]